MPKIKLDKADRAVGLYVKELNNWVCAKCKTRYDRDAPNVGKSLQCSHFWGRRNETTRFDLRNLDPLCFGCHIRVEGEKQGWYRMYMMNKLGSDEYNDLQRLRWSVFAGHKKTHRQKQYEFWKQKYIELCESKGLTPKSI